MLEQIHHKFLSLFSLVWIFNDKLIIRVQNYMKLMGKIIIFLNMHCDVYYYYAKFDIKIQLVYGEKKR